MPDRSAPSAMGGLGETTREILKLLKRGDLRSLAGALASKDVHPSIQFVKYSACGAAATLVQVACFYLLVLTVFSEALDRGLTDEVRRNHAVYANVVAFPFSNTFAYVLNVLWVFTGGRHRRFKEFLLFTVISSLSFTAGLVAGPQLILWFGVSAHVAQASFVVTAALVNYVARKFLVFSG